MFEKFLARWGLGNAADAPEGAQFYKPYAEPHVNFLYNLLFCDDLELFRNDEAAKAGSVWAMLLAASPDPEALREIAQNDEEESRVRTLAFNRLRAAGQPVPAKKLLGVVVEVFLQHGLDVVAAYPDGRVRYLNQSGKVAVFEGGPPRVEALARELIAISQGLVDKIGPWEKNRLPPPRKGNVRMTFLVSDGLYFGEGPFQVLQRDAMGGPVLAKAAELLQQAVDAALK